MLKWVGQPEMAGPLPFNRPLRSLVTVWPVGAGLRTNGLRDHRNNSLGPSLLGIVLGVRQLRTIWSLQLPQGSGLALQPVGRRPGAAASVRCGHAVRLAGMSPAALTAAGAAPPADRPRFRPSRAGAHPCQAGAADPARRSDPALGGLKRDALDSSEYTARPVVGRLQCRAVTNAALLHSVWSSGDVASAVARRHQRGWQNQRCGRPRRSRKSRL